MAAVEASVWAAAWQRASQHYLGRGLEDGCDIECLRHYLKKLERKPKGAQWRGTFMAIPTATFFLDSQPAGGCGDRGRRVHFMLETRWGLH